MTTTEIVFEVTEDAVDGTCSASPVGYGIHTQGDTLDEIRSTSRKPSTATWMTPCRARS